MLLVICGCPPCSGRLLFIDKFGFDTKLGLFGLNGVTGFTDWFFILVDFISGLSFLLRSCFLENNPIILVIYELFYYLPKSPDMIKFKNIF